MFETPWVKPARKDCFFYHTVKLPQSGTIAGEWDIMPFFDEYIGRVPLAGRTVLDVGTAGGTIAFEAERRGARVIALDMARAEQTCMVPFAGELWLDDRPSWNRTHEGFLGALKNGFWYAWHEYGSAVQVLYGDMAELAWTLPQQNVVIAGAIIEHFSDPVTAIGWMARLARETVVIAFTPVAEGPGRFMLPINTWTPANAFAWWVLSEELYRAVFDACGFDMEVMSARAVYRDGATLTRQSIVAHRRIEMAGGVRARAADAEAGASLQAAVSREIARLQAELEMLQGSLSWRITAPLRALRRRRR